jgi:pimeloyl-ACP methyl ester carboxylesterase
MTAACASSSSDRSSTSAPTTVAAGAPDYASPSNWLALPQTITRQVDVFYLSDTTYSKATPSSPDIGPIDDPKMQQGAKAKFTTTAAAFATVGNIYAPYNRQLDSQYKSSLPIPQQLSLEAGIPTSDAVSAFDYYIKNLNGGRPFILAGHSQGSDLLANLLSGYMKQHPDVYKRMIAAYVIGFSITGDYLTQNPQLKFATGPDDTGVIISYNTEAPVMKVTNPVTMPGGIAMNPITWTTSETSASAAQSLGGIEVDAQTDEAVVDASGNPVKVPNYADAQVNKQRGVVICSTADPNQLAPGNSAVAAGIYHGYDYPFYFFDIRANAENRVARYLQAQVGQEVPDYADPANWLSLPATATKEVDVFFLYPTIYQQSSPADPMVCAVNNSQMLSGAPAAFSRTATVFSPLANIYAPYYRQAAIQVLTLPLDQQQQIVGGEPTADALSAFDYYIKHLNNGRPFILAGHSQGSNIMINLMADYMKKNPEVYKRMIAAYVPGYSITPEYLAQNPELKFATGADDTQVIISYNTVSPTIKVPDPVVLPGALVINPITWTRDETVATAAQNLGGIALDSNGNAVLDAQGQPQRVLGYADAQIDTAKGELICSTADPGTLAPGNAMVTAGIYHNYDYPFYYFDLRANAENRIARHLNKGYSLVTLPQAGYQPIYDFIAGARKTLDMTILAAAISRPR